MSNSVHLLTYADRLAGDLQGLHRLLIGPLAMFDGVHILPFFAPIDGADAGFDPDDHRVVDARLGTWDDVALLAADRLLTVDLIVNHVSTRSPEFKSFVRDGDASPHAGMFLTLDRVFPEGATEDLLGRIYRPRPGLPLTPITLADGTRRILWTTFTPEQADLDVTDPGTVEYLDELLAILAAHGVDTVRLDAAGYAVKTAGTSSFMTARTRAFLAELTERASCWATRPRRGPRALAPHIGTRVGERPHVRLRAPTVGARRATYGRCCGTAALARAASPQRGHCPRHA